MVTAAGTVGLVDMRSDKERTARKTAKGARAAKRAAAEAAAQTRLLEAQNRLLQRNAPMPTPAPVAVAPISERLAELEQLATSGVITSEERDWRRAEILRSL